jgi:hypothetical protein
MSEDSEGRPSDWLGDLAVSILRGLSGCFGRFTPPSFFQASNRCVAPPKLMPIAVATA